MDIERKIQKLWDYLKVQDDELLVVPTFNVCKNADEYIVAKMECGKLEIRRMTSAPVLDASISFQLIKQIDSNGKHVIPNVEQLIKDEVLDY